MNVQPADDSSPEQHPKYRMPKHMVHGAGLAAALLTFVFLTLSEPDTEDLRWMILPYIFVPAAGGLGGLIFHLMRPMRKKGGIYKVLSVILSILIYVFLLAAGFVLGMNGPD